MTHDGAGALLALFLYPAALHLIKGGPGEMWAWVRAKWANDVTASRDTQSGKPAPTANRPPSNRPKGTRHRNRKKG